MTRTALKRNGLAELRIRYARQSAKALFKPEKQNQLLIYQVKFQKKLDFLGKIIKYNYRKVAERPEIESVHLYRIDKTEIFA